MKAFIILTFSLFTISISAQENQEVKDLFRNHCRACHSIDQDLVGPKLKDVTSRRDSAWLYAFISSSQSVIASGDSVATALFTKFNQIPMPDQPLTTGQITSILDYIDIESNPALVSEDPIARPQPTIQSNAKPLQFSDFIFWVPITVGIIAVVSILYGVIVLTEAVKKKELGVKM